MQRTTFGDLAACSIARTLDVIGEPWSPLILRDVYVGITRFDQIQADLGISRKVLSERLKRLVEGGVLERRQYQDRPPRDEYVLTAEGHRTRRPADGHGRWGDRWADDGAGPPVLYRHRACGEISHVELRCAHCGTTMRAERRRPARRSRRHDLIRSSTTTSPCLSSESTCRRQELGTRSSRVMYALRVEPTESWPLRASWS